MLFAPTKNIAILKDSLNLLIYSIISSTLTDSFKNGKAIPTASAPRAIALAASKPLRIPPEEITGTSTEEVTSTVLIAVGIPQSQKVSPKYLSSALYVSTAAQLVPPAPSISI